MTYKSKMINAKERLFFAVGPGDVCSAYESWSAGVRHASETSITYSSQCMGFCKDGGISALFVSYSTQEKILVDGIFLLKNISKPILFNFPGKYFVREFLYSLLLANEARKFNASVAVIDSGTTEWFMLWPFKLFGIKVIPDFHNTYNPDGYPFQRIGRKIIRCIDSAYFRFFTSCAMGVSPACGRQYLKLAGSGKKYFDYRGQFDPNDFVDASLPKYSPDVFNLLYVGRLEKDKGIYDMLEILQVLDNSRPGSFTLEICGDGSERSGVERKVEERKISHLVKVSGRLNREQLLDAYRQSHLVVVPTQSTFTEGLSLACVESVLMNRPVVTSKVVPALEVLAGAAVEAQTDDVNSYAAKILELSQSSSKYMQKVDECRGSAAVFLDSSFGIRSALAMALDASGPSKLP